MLQTVIKRVLTCDMCGKTLEISNASLLIAYTLAKQKGWKQRQITNKLQDLCLDCIKQNL